MNTAQQSPAELVREYARHTIGSESFYRHSDFSSIVYTDGIKFVAEQCDAHWLIDAVDSWQQRAHRAQRKLGLRDFQVWRLSFLEASEVWALECWTDTPGESERVVAQSICFSDFPRDLAPFEFWVEDGVMMLKEER